MTQKIHSNSSMILENKYVIVQLFLHINRFSTKTKQPTTPWFCLRVPSFKTHATPLIKLFNEVSRKIFLFDNQPRMVGNTAYRHSDQIIFFFKIYIAECYHNLMFQFFKIFQFQPIFALKSCLRCQNRGYQVDYSSHSDSLRSFTLYFEKFSYGIMGIFRDLMHHHFPPLFLSFDHLYVGQSSSFEHLQISALLVRISKNWAKYVQIWSLAEKLRHWETTSDHPTGLYRGWIWGHIIQPNVLALAKNCSFFGKNFKKLG